MLDVPYTVARPVGKQTQYSDERNLTKGDADWIERELLARQVDPNGDCRLVLMCRQRPADELGDSEIDFRYMRRAYNSQQAKPTILISKADEDWSERARLAMKHGYEAVITD